MTTLTERCERTDLLRTDCAHCRPAPARPPAPADLADLDFDEPGGDVGSVFTASYHSTCPECGNPVEPGDQARMVDGEATHEECT